MNKIPFLSKLHVFNSPNPSNQSQLDNDSLVCEQLEDRFMLSTVNILAAGTTGQEIMELQIDGQTVQTWQNIGGNANQGQFQTYSYATEANLSADQIRIRFTNDLYDPENNIDRNLRVDAIEIDSQRIETEAPTVFSTGTWLPADGIADGFRQSEFLHSNGYFQFADPQSDNGSLITINARGTTGQEQFDLFVSGSRVATYNARQQADTFTYRADSIVSVDQVRIEFTNDLYDPSNGIDRNLTIDFINLDGTTYQSEAPNVYSTGTWRFIDGLQPGYRQRQVLHTNGYFQYGGQADIQSGTIGLTLDSLSVDEDLGTLNFVIFRSEGTDGSVTVNYATQTSTAGADDFMATSGTAVFGDGISGRQFSIPINDDNLIEGPESFTIELSNPTGGATLGAITTQTVTINDNDENFTGVIFADSFDSSSNWTTNPFGGDDATAGQWEIGSPQQTAIGTTVLQPNSGHTGPGALVTGLAAGSSAGSFDVDGGVTSVLSPLIDIPVGAEVEFRFEYSFAYLGNASNDDYFSASIVSGGQIVEVFEDHAHDSDQSTSWTLVTRDISSYAGSSIQILFQAADELGNSLIEAAVDDVAVEVLPNLPGTIEVQRTSINLDEDAGVAEIVLVRNAGREGVVTVDYGTKSGSATAADYTPTFGTATFQDGAPEATILIPINDDTTTEQLESFTLELSNPTGGAILGSDNVATITIVDNDNATADYLPDLTPIGSTLTENLSIDSSEIPGRRLLRFSTEVANAGEGPLELWGGEVSGDSQQVFQRVYQVDGSSRDRLAGEFVYHPGHGHIHFEGFATYDLILLDDNGTIIASGGKTSFCLINIRQPMPDVTADAGRVHGRGGSNCGNIQGISAGYSDVYSASLDDQWIDITDVPDGTYTLRIQADPENNLQESDENNNTAEVQVTISNGNVTGI